jgi:hypothetical protein
MARDVEADVQINDKSSKGLGSFLAGLRKASDGAKNTQKEIDKASASTGKLSKETEENAKAFSKLSNELEVSKKELGSLAKAFANAGDAAERSDISKAMAKQQTEIRKLTKNHDILKDLLPSESEVEKETAQFGQRFSEGLEAAKGALVPGLAAAAPLIGALLSAAVIGGAGIGGIVGGVLVASRDPRVVAAATAMKSEIGKELTGAATPFVQVSLDGIAQIGQAVKGIDFKDIFAQSAKNAQPVINGIEKAVDGLGDGLAALISRSGPVMVQLGALIGNVGEHVGQFFDTISHGGAGAADSIKDVATAIDTVLNVAGPLILTLTDIYAVAHRIGATEQFFTGLLGPIGQIGDLLSHTGLSGGKAAGSLTLVQKGVQSVSASVQTAGDSILTFTERLDDAASAGQSLYASTTSVAQAAADLKKSLKDNGKSLDENTAKGRNNRTALVDLAGALTSNYDAYVKVNGEGIKSNGVAASNRAQFIKLATQFHLSKSAAGALATQLGLIPAKKNTSFTANTHDAAARIEALKEQISTVHGKSVSITVAASISNKSANTLARLGANFDATDYFAAAGPSDGQRRSGGNGSDAIDVNSTSNVTVLLDGKPFRAYVDRSQGKAAWRQKVGRR